MSGAVTAVVATVAALSTAEVFTAVAVAGAVIGAVGTVTGIKPLQYAGLALGAVGGIGALATSAGLFAGDALTAGGGLASDGGFAGAVGSDVAAGSAAAISPQAQALVDAGLDAGTQSAGISSDVAGGDIINMASGQVSVPGQASASSTATLQTSGEPNLADPTANTTAGNQVQTPVAATDNGNPINATSSGQTTDTTATAGQPADAQTPAAPAAPTLSAPGTPGTPSAISSNILGGGQGVTGVPDPSGIAAPSGLTSPTASTPSAFSNVLNFAKNNQTIVGGAIQASAALIAGATSSLTPAQVAALNAQANANQATANLSTQQLANMQAPIPIASRPAAANVTGTPAPTGLVNAAPPQAA